MPRPVELEVRADDFRALARAMRQEADGKRLRRDMVRNLRVAVNPAVAEVRAAVRALPSEGGPRDGAALRQTVAQKVRPQVRLSGRSPGVSIKAKKTGMPRGFKNAPKRLNSKGGWRHPVFGSRSIFVHQTVSRPGWFDDTLRRRRDRYREAVSNAVVDMARRLASRGNRGI